LIAGMYRYIGKEGNLITTKYPSDDSEIRNIPKNLKSDAKTKRIFKFCNYPEEISIRTEG
jgi:hypothetical protein